jgi:hypothetical protein
VRTWRGRHGARKRSASALAHRRYKMSMEEDYDYGEHQLSKAPIGHGKVMQVQRKV